MTREGTRGVFLPHRHKPRAVFLPGECGDCVETGDLLGRCLLPHISPWSPVVHTEPEEGEGQEGEDSFQCIPSTMIADVMD